jgi:hypothetical protein
MVKLSCVVCSIYESFENFSGFLRGLGRLGIGGDK